MTDGQHVFGAVSTSENQNAVGETMSFRDLAEYAKRTFYRPAEIVEGRTVSGIRSHRATHSQIDILVEYFGERKLASLNSSDLNGFKALRIKQGDRRGKLGKLSPV